MLPGCCFQQGPVSTATSMKQVGWVGENFPCKTIGFRVEGLRLRVKGLGLRVIRIGILLYNSNKKISNNSNTMIGIIVCFLFDTPTY